MVYVRGHPRDFDVWDAELKNYVVLAHSPSALLQQAGTVGMFAVRLLPKHLVVLLTP